MPTIFQSPNPPASTKSKKIVAASGIGPLTCFAVNPTGVRFETQEDAETVVLFLRQHFIVNVPWILLTILLILGPSVLFPLFSGIIGMTVTIPLGYILAGTIFWYIATFGFVLAKFLGWFFNIYIVTNERVVDIDFYYLLYKNFSQAELNKVQDISFSSGEFFHPSYPSTPIHL